VDARHPYPGRHDTPGENSPAGAATGPGGPAPTSDDSGHGGRVRGPPGAGGARAVHSVVVSPGAILSWTAARRYLRAA